MRNYDYSSKWKKLLTPDIVALLTQIHEYKGEQILFIEAKTDILTKLVEVAKIQSAAASNKIEGIYTSDDRLKMILRDRTIPKTRNEQEIAGYRDVLSTIHESYEHIPPKPSIILQLHRDLYRFNGLRDGGKYKNSDNFISEEDDKVICFQPVTAWETPGSMEALCKAFEDVTKEVNVDPLLIIPMFILDFLCIHPFSDGSERMSRLLTLLLLYRSGYIVGKYISIERIIEKTQEKYYEALQESSQGWHEEENDYEPFVKYTLGIVASAYKEFSSRVKLPAISGMSKPERIKELIRETVGKITKAEILEKCPDISDTTVQRTLTELHKNGTIIKISGGRYTSYIWNWEGEHE